MKRPACVLLLALTAIGAFAQPGAEKDRWVGAWATSLVGRPADLSAGTPPPARPPLNVSNQTLRQIVRSSIGGNSVRVVVSNTFGTVPLEIGAAHVALRDKGSAIVPASDRPLSFSGRASIAIPPAAIALSDPVTLVVPPLGSLAVDVFLPGATTGTPLTLHSGALQTSYVSAPGNHAGAADFPVAATTQSWFLLARVDVSAPGSPPVIVAIGDSITDGLRSTPDANTRWPDVLANRLAAAGHRIAVLNAGISGNRVLSEGAWSAGQNALARFDRDVLMMAGATHVIVLEGINDIGAARQSPSPGAADLIAGHRQLIARAHARGMKIYGATLTPFEGAPYFTPEGEAKRQALNEWIRTGKEYDGAIDFDAAVRDPEQPSRFVAEYQSGDNLHPSDAGYRAMGNAIDLTLFTRR